MASWVSVSSDPQNYGEIKVLKLPTTGSSQVEGPGQIQRRFQTTPKVTENRTLFQNQSVTVRFGNLLTVPYGGGLLYVEPIYIQTKDDANAFPQMARVLVSFGNRVGFNADIREALKEVFGPGVGDAATPPEGQAPPTSSPPSTSGTVQPPPSGGTGSSPELDEAVRAMDAAATKLKAAQQSGNFAEQGQALQELDNAIKRFLNAKAALGGSSSPPSSPTTTPTPTPGSGGG